MKSCMLNKLYVSIIFLEIRFKKNDQNNLEKGSKSNFKLCKNTCARKLEKSREIMEICHKETAIFCFLLVNN